MDIESWDDSDFVFPSTASPFFACSESDATDSDASPLHWPSDDDDYHDKSSTIKALAPSHLATLRSNTPKASTIAPLLVPKRPKHHDSDFVDLPASMQRVDLTPRRAKHALVPTPSSSRRRHAQAWSQSSTASTSSLSDADDLFDDLVLPPFLGGPGVVTPPSSVKSSTASASPKSKLDLQLLLQNKMQSRLLQHHQPKIASATATTTTTTTTAPRSVSQKAYPSLSHIDNKNHHHAPSTINTVRPRHKSQSFTADIHSSSSSPSTQRTRQHSRDKSASSLCVADPFGRASFALGKPIAPSTPPVSQDRPSRQPSQQHRLPNTNNTTNSNGQQHKVKRVRHHGDGTELDVFEDLPVDTDKERKFIKVSKRVSSQKYSNTNNDQTPRKRGLPLSVSNIPPSNDFSQKPLKAEPRRDVSSETRTRSTSSRRTTSSSRRPALITNYSTVTAYQNRPPQQQPTTRSVSQAIRTSSKRGEARVVGGMVFDPERMCWLSRNPDDEDELDLDSVMEQDDNDYFGSYNEYSHKDDNKTMKSTPSSNLFKHASTPKTKNTLDAWADGELGRLKKKTSFLSNASGSQYRYPSTTTTSSHNDSFQEEDDQEPLHPINNNVKSSDVADALGWDNQGQVFWQDCKKAEKRHADEMQPWTLFSSPSTPAPAPHKEDDVDRSYLWSIRQIVMDL